MQGPVHPNPGPGEGGREPQGPFADRLAQLSFLCRGQSPPWQPYLLFSCSVMSDPVRPHGLYSPPGSSIQGFSKQGYWSG